MCHVTLLYHFWTPIIWAIQKYQFHLKIIGLKVENCVICNVFCLLRTQIDHFRLQYSKIFQVFGDKFMLNVAFIKYSINSAFWNCALYFYTSKIEVYRTRNTKIDLGGSIFQLQQSHAPFWNAETLYFLLRRSLIISVSYWACNRLSGKTRPTLYIEADIQTVWNKRCTLLGMEAQQELGNGLFGDLSISCVGN